MLNKFRSDFIQIKFKFIYIIFFPFPYLNFEHAPHQILLSAFICPCPLSTFKFTWTFRKCEQRERKKNTFNWTDERTNKWKFSPAPPFWLRCCLFFSACSFSLHWILFYFCIKKLCLLHLIIEFGILHTSVTSSFTILKRLRMRVFILFSLRFSALFALWPSILMRLFCIWIAILLHCI